MPSEQIIYRNDPLGAPVDYRATHLHLIEFEWFLLFLYASFLKAVRHVLISGPVL